MPIEMTVNDPKSLIYVETSTISFYHETRTETPMVARRDWTRSWWETAQEESNLTTSLAVVEELQRGDYPSKPECLQLASTLPLLDISTEIAAIVSTYIQHQVMPSDPAGDALHLAIASFHRCDYLVTWNCQHLANARKFGHIRALNGMLGADSRKGDAAAARVT